MNADILLSPGACLREAPPAKVLVRRAGASVKAGERDRVRGNVIFEL